MKKLSILFIAMGLVVGCSNAKKENKESPSGFVEVEGTESRGEALPDTAAIIELMEYYQDVDSVETNKRFETYKSLVESRADFNQEDIQWYFKNIRHIDSVSKEAIKLTRNKQYEDLGLLLDSELGNFYGHPNSDTYSIYELSWAMLPLYRMITPDSKTYYDKLIKMWEMNRLLMETVQIQTGEPHPYYLRMMYELSSLYDKAGEKDKKKKVDDIIESVETE